MGNFDWKYICAFVVGGILILLSFLFWSNILVAITMFFSTKIPDIVLGSLSALTTVLHKIKFKKINFNHKMSFNEFRIPAEDLLSFVSNPVTIVCSLSLARGLFMQTTGCEIHFPKLNNVEQGFVFIVTAYLLYISLTELVRNLYELFRKQGQVSVPTASDEQGNAIEPVTQEE